MEDLKRLSQKAIDAAKGINVSVKANSGSLYIDGERKVDVLVARKAIVNALSDCGRKLTKISHRGYKCWRLECGDVRVGVQISRTEAELEAIAIGGGFSLRG